MKRKSKIAQCLSVERWGTRNTNTWTRYHVAVRPWCEADYVWLKVAVQGPNPATRKKVARLLCVAHVDGEAFAVPEGYHYDAPSQLYGADI